MRPLGLMLLAGCGRFGFSDAVPPSDAVLLIDAAPSACTVQISGGGDHTCALRHDATMWCWGHNQHGQLGDGTIGNSTLPVLVTETAGGAPFAGVAQISAGVQDMTCALRDDTSVWCWGENELGQVGDGTTTDRWSPTQVMRSPGVPLTGAAEVAAAEWHACARLLDGAHWCWGDNLRSLLGDGTGLARSAPVRVLTAAGPLVAPDGLHASALHSLAWGPVGQLWVWGTGDEGQLGTGMTSPELFATAITLSRVTSAGGASNHACVALSNTQAFCFGRGYSGQLGDGTSTDSSLPVMVLDAGGQPFPVTRIVAGDSHSCATQADGSLWCWGSNDEGAVASSMTPNVPSPARVTLPGTVIEVATGNNHTCATLADDTTYCWGRNVFGQLGNGSTASTATPTPVMSICP